MAYKHHRKETMMPEKDEGKKGKERIEKNQTKLLFVASFSYLKRSLLK